MAWRFSGRLNVIVHTSANPSTLEWQQLLKEGDERGDAENRRVLVVTYGGGPDVDQRKQLARSMGKKPAPIAIMTASPMVRGIMAALAFFNRRMKAVELHDSEGAFMHLELTGAERQHAQSLRLELEGELGISSREHNRR